MACCPSPCPFSQRMSLFGSVEKSRWNAFRRLRDRPQELSGYPWTSSQAAFLEVSIGECGPRWTRFVARLRNSNCYSKDRGATTDLDQRCGDGARVLPATP